jgi:hypothetical protein
MGFDGDNLDKKYSAGYIGDDVYDDIERMCEGKNIEHPRNDANEMNDKKCNYDNDDIGNGHRLKNEYYDWKHRNRDDSENVRYICIYIYIYI